jgi:hypothetical protein
MASTKAWIVLIEVLFLVIRGNGESEMDDVGREEGRGEVKARIVEMIRDQGDKVGVGSGSGLLLIYY